MQCCTVICGMRDYLCGTTCANRALHCIWLTHVCAADTSLADHHHVLHYAAALSSQITCTQAGGSVQALIQLVQCIADGAKLPGLTQPQLQLTSRTADQHQAADAKPRHAQSTEQIFGKGNERKRPGTRRNGVKPAQPQQKEGPVDLLDSDEEAPEEAAAAAAPPPPIAANVTTRSGRATTIPAGLDVQLQVCAVPASSKLCKTVSWPFF